MAIHERRLQARDGRAFDALGAFLRLRGDRPAVLLDGGLGRVDRPTRVLFEPFEVFSIAAGSDRLPEGLDPFARLLVELKSLCGDVVAPARRRAGAAGFFGYDRGRHLERMPRTAAIETAVPDLWFAFFDRGIEVDPRTGEAAAFVEDLPGRALEEDPERILDRIERTLASPAPALGGGDAGVLASNFAPDAYRAAVERVRELIRDGDVYQVNLSQRFRAPFSGDALAVAARLRAMNPAPHGAIVSAPEFTLVSASPESFLETRGERVVTRPIKGTRPRGTTPAEDAQLVSELAASAKDGAELAMIVDLERNDLGRVAKFGSVAVVEASAIEHHPSVLHKVATVEARLRDGVTRADLLRATFPGGSITGCPKIRAMEVIEEIERTRRGVFTGSIGFVGFDGDLSLNIAIRTLVFERSEVHFHVGGGIVLDSDPDAEYRETLVKGGALARALGCDRLGAADPDR